MRVAVSSKGRDLDAQFDFRFGKCPYFILLESATHLYSLLPNPFEGLEGGGGLKIARLLIEERVEVVITGVLNPRAFDILMANGIAVYFGRGSNIREVIGEWEANELPMIGREEVVRYFSRNIGKCWKGGENAKGAL